MTTKPFNLAFHRQQLAEWVAAYQLDRQLREPEPDQPETSVYNKNAQDAPLPAPGQIRLLAPTTVSLPEAERPVYVLLMPAESSDTIRLFPFSRYPIPATPQEWRTGFDQQPLRVLCLWNQHVCDRAHLPANWLVRTITPKQQAEVARVLQMSHDLQTYASRRFGPPLLHPFDPRHVYLQEERMLLDDLCMVLDETTPMIIEYPVSETDTSYRRAAEASADYVVNDPLFRPPGEAQSLILQIDEGCPWNRCTFCGMYKGMPFRRRPLADVCTLIEQEAKRHSGVRRIFLADGDVLSRPFAELRMILQTLHVHFPRITRVSLYANGSSIAARTEAELAALKSLKLHTLYMGLESGDAEILQRCRKRETAAEMIDACVMAQAAGLRMSVMILLGLGGIERSRQHIAHTTAALNRMQPRLLSALRVIPVAGTKLHEDMRNGTFTPLSEFGAVSELREIIAGLELASTVFRANHSSNSVPVEARLPHDKDRIVAALDALLDTDRLDRETTGTMPRWL